MSVARPTKYSNPYRIGDPDVPDAETAVRLFRELPHDLDALRADLRKKDLACWCRLDQPCHADVLLELANNGGERDGDGT